MKNTLFCLVINSLFLLISNLSNAQDNIYHSPQNQNLKGFESSMEDYYHQMLPDKKLLSSKSYEWLPNFNENRFKNTGWSVFKEAFTIGIEIVKDTPVDFRIFNSDGLLILSKQQELPQGIHRFFIDAKEWEKGGYIVQIQTNQGEVIKKMVKG